MSWIERMLTQTISYALPTGVSGNDVSFDAVQTTSARVETAHQIVRATDELELVGTHKVATSIEIPLHARVWLPGVATDAANALTVLSVKGGTSMRGAQLFEAVLG